MDSWPHSRRREHPSPPTTNSPRENLQTIGTIKLIDFGWDEYAQHFAGTLEVESLVGPLLDVDLKGPTPRVTLRIGTGPIKPTQAGVQAVMDRASTLLADLRIALNAIYRHYKALELPLNDK